MKVVCLSVIALWLTAGFSVYAQDASRTPTSLKELLAEAQNNNPKIRAAEHGWRAATHVAQQVTTLPDPHFSVQQLNVGSPDLSPDSATATLPIPASAPRRSFLIQASYA